MQDNPRENSDEKGVAARDAQASFSAMSLAWELGYMIAIPLVALALIGRFMDNKLGTTPFLLLIGIIVSVAISSYMVYKKTIDIINRK